MKKKNNLLKTLDWQRHMGADEIIVAAPADFDGAQKKKRRGRPPGSSTSQGLAAAAAVPAKRHMPAVDLSAIHDLEQLKAALDQYDGCALKGGATQMVFSDGNPAAKVMIVGEAPGAEEDRLGKPFVGRSGQLLDQIFKSIGLTRANMYISNIVPWRPPNNRPPTDAEINQCLPFIEKHIALIQPKILVLAGGTATKSLLKTNNGIMSLRGRFTAYTNEYMAGKTLEALPTFHPAYLLRSPGQKRWVWQDMLLLKKSLSQSM